MMGRETTLAAIRPRAAFSLWGWAMLLVIMLSAAPTGGALRTQVFGSAFDPATYSVTTAPKRQSPLAEIQRVTGDEPDDAPAFHMPQAADVYTRPAPLVGQARVDGQPPVSNRGTAVPLIADNRAARAPPSN
jgi:hypothetical protein